jgi:hypothetical protein
MSGARPQTPSAFMSYASRRAVLVTAIGSLAYASTQEWAYNRAASRADRIRERLGWAPGILNCPELRRKPKRMRWATFSPLRQAHDQHTGRPLAGIAARIA